MRKGKKFKIVGRYVDIYTYDLIPFDKIISISSEEAARKWFLSSYYKAHIYSVEEYKS